MDDMVRRSKGPRIDLSDTPTKRNIDLTEPQEDAVVEEQPVQPVGPELPGESTPAPKDSPATGPVKTPRWPRLKLKVPVPKTKLQWGIAIAVMVVLLGGAGSAIYWFIIRKEPAPIISQEPEPEPEPLPEPIYSIVSGRELTDKAINDRPVYAVQIENSPEARPQSGLKEADIVSEAVAEGGITRFNAIFHDNIPANIGPVRSLRPYYIDWFLPYDAAIVHAGGSGEALADVGSLGLKDIDSDPAVMRRISSRYSPHNYYTRGQQVLDLLVKRGYKPNVASPLPRKYPPKESDTEDTDPPAETEPAKPGATDISIKISSTLYNVRYIWDTASGSYLRMQGGSKHVDAESGKQLAPNVVIVPILGKRIHPDRVHTQYDTTGSGKVYVFQDGTVTEGTWTKPLRAAQWVLKDAAGAEIKLNPGQTWFTITDAAGNVSY